MHFKHYEVQTFFYLGFSGDHIGSIGVVGLSLGVVGSAEETTAEGTTMEGMDAVFESIFNYLFKGFINSTFLVWFISYKGLFLSDSKQKCIFILSKLFLAASYVRALL